MYQRVLEAFVNEELTCQRERGNLVDPFSLGLVVASSFEKSCITALFPCIQAYHAMLACCSGVNIHVAYSPLHFDEGLVFRRSSTASSASLTGPRFNWQFTFEGLKKQ